MALRCLALLLLSTPLLAAVPVEERGGAEPAKTGMAPPPRVYNTPQNAPPPQQASGLAELFNELQLLRGEVQELRGLTEEQAYRIKQLEAKQDEQYRDIDGRLAALATAPRPGPAAATSGDTAESAPRTITRSTNITGNIPGNEKDAYAAAFDAMKARQFDASIDQFAVFVQTYPNGELTPNAFYWLGELHLAKNDTEQARQAFAQLINLYPAHQKVPDAMYKMGVVYHRLGDRARALDYLQRVRGEHPGSSAAGLAETYAAELE